MRHNIDRSGLNLARAAMLHHTLQYSKRETSFKYDICLGFVFVLRWQASLSVYFARFHGPSVCVKQCKGEILRISIYEDGPEDSNAGYCSLECEFHRPTTLPRLTYLILEIFLKMFCMMQLVKQTRQKLYVISLVLYRNRTRMIRMY